MRWNCLQLSGKALPAIQSTKLEAGTVGTRPSQHIYFLSALRLVCVFLWIGVRRWWQLLAPDWASVVFLVKTPPKSIPVPLQQHHWPCPQTLCPSFSADRGLRDTAWKSQVLWLGNRSLCLALSVTMSCWPWEDHVSTVPQPYKARNTCLPTQLDGCAFPVRRSECEGAGGIQVLDKHRVVA